MTRLVPKHPRAICWFHWINFPLLTIMAWSGLLIYWADDAYRIGWSDVTLFHFFPNWFYKTFHVGYRLAEGMAWHFAFAWLFAVNGAAYVVTRYFPANGGILCRTATPCGKPSRLRSTIFA